MKKLLLTLVVLFPLLAIAQVKFTPMKFTEAMNLAQKNGKCLLVDVARSDENAKIMKTVFKDKKLSKFIADNFMTISVDMMNEAESEDFIPYMQSLSYPCLIFYSPRGEQLAFSNWYFISEGKTSLEAVAKKALEVANVKRENTRSIKFRDLDYKQALEAAKTEGKMLFIDNYIIGCGPCKRMDADVFTLNSVADYYNENFVCIKLDAGKDPHNVAKNNGVKGFPAYLFFDADGGLVLNEGGFTEEQPFLEIGKKAISDYNANKTINLLNLPLEEIKALAKKEGKMIFVDLSATWCGPCKAMKKDIFTIPAVARFFNKNFVSLFVECDIEKEKAEQLKTLYGYSAFPTMLFLNAEGELIHKIVGSSETGADFIASAQKALDNKGLKAYNDRYAAGEKTPEFIKEYIVVLGESYEKEKAAKVAEDYLNALTLDQLMTKENFTILKDNILELDAKPFQLFAANRAKFYDVASKQEVDMYYNMLWYIKGRSFVSKGEKPVLDKVGYNAFISRLKKSDVDNDTKGKVIFESKVNNAEMTGNWKEYIDIVSVSMKDGSEYPMVVYNWGLRVEQKCQDPVLRERFAKLAENYMVAYKKKMANAPAPKPGEMVMMTSGGDADYIQEIINDLRK